MKSSRTAIHKGLLAFGSALLLVVVLQLVAAGPVWGHLGATFAYAEEEKQDSVQTEIYLAADTSESSVTPATHVTNEDLAKTGDATSSLPIAAAFVGAVAVAGVAVYKLKISQHTEGGENN